MTLCVRPYGQRIRKPVFEAFERAGFPVDDVIEPKTTDLEAIEHILRHERRCPLLIPFHAHKDNDGVLVNGLDLLSRLHEEHPDVVKRPLVMPVSSIGKAAHTLLRSRGGLDGLHLLTVEEHHMTDTLHHLLREHCLAKPAD